MGFANLLIKMKDSVTIFYRWHKTGITYDTVKFKQLCDEKPRYVLSLIHFFNLNAELQVFI